VPSCFLLFTLSGAGETYAYNVGQHFNQFQKVTRESKNAGHIGAVVNRPASVLGYAPTVLTDILTDCQADVFGQ
jgi:hypothetical protein